MVITKKLQEECKKSIEELKISAEKKGLFEHSGKFLSESEYKEALVNEAKRLIERKKEDGRLEEAQNIDEQKYGGYYGRFEETDYKKRKLCCLFFGYFRI